jgi:hypothetical protein
MMAEEEYEVIPHKLLQSLKYDVEALQKKLSEPDAKMNELILEIESMKDVTHELQQIFTKALEEMKGEDSGGLQHINEKMATVVTQNETIARGMVAISDKLEAFMKDSGGVKPMLSPSMPSMPPLQHTMGPPAMPGPARVAPHDPNEISFPPPPPGASRKGLFK